MDLIVLESPNKVRDVQHYARAAGFEAAVMATVGHVLDLPPMSDGPAIDTATFLLDRLQPRDLAAGERITRIRLAIATAQRVIVATDPDREGEAIGAEVWAWIPPEKAHRATFEEITARGVGKGLGEMRSSLAGAAVEAAHARRIIDRLTGWHGTALVFDKLRQHRGLSAGRLQSAALRLLVERHREHMAFVPETTYGVRASLRKAGGGELAAVLVDDEGRPRTFSTEREAGAVVLSGPVVVTAVDRERKHQPPKPPFEASSWLQVAAKALGLTVKDATEATQTLFETGQTTYPRTDSVRVADDAIAWARSEIERRFGRAYVPDAPWEHKDRGSAATQGAHEAIRPTIPHDDVAAISAPRGGQWSDAYALIESRFLASQAAARVVDHTIVRIRGEGFALRAKGQVELFDGWKRVLATPAEEEPVSSAARDRDDGESAEEDLPPLASGEHLEVVGSEITTHVSKPKPLLTQASLVAELKRLGIGRPSTYQAVVPLVLSRGWATEESPKGKTRAATSGARSLPVLVPTQAGRDLCAFLAEALPSLVDYDFTASMEKALDEIEAGQRTRVDVARGWWSRFEQELLAAKAIAPRLIERKDLGPCPKCTSENRSGHLRLIQGVNPETKKPYEFAACDADTRDSRACGHKAQVKDGQLIVSPPCPSCQAPLRAVNRKDGGHSWRCEKDGWFLAGRRWQLVLAPPCPQCAAPMVHRERRDPKGEFFWACFAHRVFMSSDRFGAVEKRRHGGTG
jgi:DNA topoisomerase-1